MNPRDLINIPKKAYSSTFLSYLLLGLFVFPTILQAQDKPSIKVPAGFEVTLFADDDLAHNIYSMTVDSLGRVVVSGPGYVKILIDSDGDGRADIAKQFADGPASGAQGMYFLGRDLLCIGDEGLIRYRDKNNDDRADGPPDVFLKLKTGGEHYAHSFQKGPDGWWYLIAGNFAEINETYATLKTSPIKHPSAGTIVRLHPQLTGGEILADGFRNAYDFAFNKQGDVFTFDSDGERDVSLPWYRPTRVFHVVPGSSAGWVSRSWKHPDYFFDMPGTVASFDRGSPTGVACYRHTQFPKQFQNAPFVLDWTYGRVMAVPLERAGSTWKSEPTTFMSGIGQFGFAPTDVEVGPKGSLFVSVGGRGTRGSVYQVRYVGDKKTKVESDEPIEAPKPTDRQPPKLLFSPETSAAADENVAKVPQSKTDTQQLLSCLDAPQPLSSWSRAIWIPQAHELGQEVFLESALNEKLSADRRIRSIEILTELFDGLNPEIAKFLSAADSAEVRARAVWSLGRTSPEKFNPQAHPVFLNDLDAFVGRCALESLLGIESENDLSLLLDGLNRHLGHSDRFNRYAAARLIPKLSDDEFQQLSVLATESSWQAAIANALGFLARNPGFQEYYFQLGLPILEDDFSDDLKLEAILLMQFGLGAMGPTEDLPPVFDGYHSRIDISKHERQLDPFRIQIAKIYPTGNAKLDYELARLIALLAPLNPTLLDKVLDNITDESDPVLDIHHLIVAARIPVEFNGKQQSRIAKALVNLESKIAQRKMKQDSNWSERIAELYKHLIKRDDALPIAIVNQENFGQAGHIMFLSQLPGEFFDQAVNAFSNKISEMGDEYSWTFDVIFLLGESDDPKLRELIREQYENFAVRSAVLRVLARKPEETDREKFVEGLESSFLEVLQSCLDALLKLSPDDNPAEQVALLSTLRRLGRDPAEFPVREKVVQLLRQNNEQDFGFETGKAGYNPQADVVSKWTDWISEKYKDQADQLLGNSNAEFSNLKERLEEVDWDEGNLERGLKLFQSRSCVQCHGSRRALGPDLAGAASRFSRDDLFTAIVLPNRDVSPRYQTTLIGTKAGKVYTGLIIYESVDGLLLRNATNQTFRIEASEIDFRRVMKTALMPPGLLKGLSETDLADLYLYLRSLGKQAVSEQSTQTQ